MNKFIHRILKSSSGTSITKSHPTSSVQHLLDEIHNAKLLYFGEFHSESRIVSFQTELVKEWSRRLAADNKTRLHLIMEHFSVDMQPILDAYQLKSEDKFMSNDKEALEQLIHSYKHDYGTEGHDLLPYSELLQFCRRSTLNNDSDAKHCEVHLHGGFIPRNHAARLNKECPDDESKRRFFEEMSERGYLPQKGDAMHNSLFEEGSNVKLGGLKEHKLLIRSLMTGMDLYSPVDDNTQEPNDAEDGEETPFDRLYQAQLLKDHAMGYKVANIMLGQPPSDRFLVIAGFGHLKHRLGVPHCVNQYLKQTALLDADEARRASALDLLLNTSNLPAKSPGRGAASIGCQMMYEAYLEDHYPPLAEAIREATEEDQEADTDDVKRGMMKSLYLANPATLDEYILKSEEVAGPFLNYNGGVGGFDHPCADYLFVYDEDDDNIITESDTNNMAINSGNGTCPFHSGTSANDQAKKETLDAYNNVGRTAGIKGNAARARAIMTQLGYSEEDLSYLGDGDIYNFQGVANPHSVAKIQTGERMIDIGSGLGIDSFLAMRDCGADKVKSDSGSFVVGVDLAPSEVQHATRRARDRGYEVPARLRFIQGDVEILQSVLAKNNVPSEGSFDVCISNGAFCLVPDKKKAFENVFKALRPGGRCAISTTAIVSDHLDPSFEWPVCMRMFAPLESLQPMLEDIGFTNVQIIDAESPMEGMELPEEASEDEAGGIKRFKIHGKYVDQFAFLEKMDMDELCKVVTVYGEKK